VTTIVVKAQERTSRWAQRLRRLRSADGCSISALLESLADSSQALDCRPSRCTRGRRSCWLSRLGSRRVKEVIRHPPSPQLRSGSTTSPGRGSCRGRSAVTRPPTAGRYPALLSPGRAGSLAPGGWLPAAAPGSQFSSTDDWFAPTWRSTEFIGTRPVWSSGCRLRNCCQQFGLSG
jgi:hypothetical protein